MRDDEDDFINLGEIIAVLLEYKWLILAVTFLAVFIGAVTAFVSTPIYRADALLQVEDKSKMKGGIAALADVEGVLGDNTSVAAELEILRDQVSHCLLYTSPSPRDRTRSRMPSSA